MGRKGNLDSQSVSKINISREDDSQRETCEHRAGKEAPHLQLHSLIFTEMYERIIKNILQM